MPHPRVRLRALMIAVAMASTSLAILASAELGRSRTGEAVVNVTNRTSAPLDDVRLIHSEGEHRIGRLRPGAMYECRIRLSGPEVVRIRQPNRAGSPRL